MIQVNDKLWIGNTIDEANLDFDVKGITGILMVAHDMQQLNRYRLTAKSEVEYMQVGLIDGPGNTMMAYHAAVLALAAIIKRRQVMVCCHGMERSIAVVAMYLRLTQGRGWDWWVGKLCGMLDNDAPTIHEEHKLAFYKLNWRLLNTVIE